MLEFKQFWGTIDIFFLLWKSMVPQSGLVTDLIQNIYPSVQQNKEMNSDLEELEVE